jgi:hypothetical protein
MSNAIINAIRGIQLPAREKLVLFVLADRANDDGISFPSMGMLVGDTCLCERSIQGAVTALVRGGLIAVSGGGGRGIRNQYMVFPGSKNPANGVENPADRATFELRKPRKICTKTPQNLHENPAKSAVHIDNHQYTHQVYHHGTNDAGDDLLFPDIAAPSSGGSRPYSGRVLVNGNLQAFLEFYDRYPLKRAKGRAEKAFAAAIKHTTPAQIMAGLDRFRFPSQKWIPHPATWLNDHRWEDVQETGDPVLRALGLYGGDVGHLIEGSLT